MLKLKRSIRAVLVLAALAAHASATAAPPAPAGTPARACESLATLKLPDTTIALARTETSGSFTPPAGQPLTGLPAFCLVAGVIRPSPDSQIQFEVWMPTTGWNRKLEGVGNGGFAGSISHFDLSRAVSHGYASASTDTGHEASPVDATWALGHPEKIVDFGHRAVHEMTAKAKDVIEAFYGEAPRRSYFASCSNGGRQGLGDRHEAGRGQLRGRSVDGAPALPLPAGCRLQGRRQPRRPLGLHLRSAVAGDAQNLGARFCG